MKKLISIFAVLSFVSAAHAQSFTDRLKDGTDTVRLLLGSSQGSTNVGIDYERRNGGTALGAFLLQTAKRTVDNTANPLLTTLSRPETWNLGFTAPMHLVDHSNFDLYVAPAVALIGVRDVPQGGGNNKDVVTFGPALKIGAMCYLHNHWSVGLDFLTLTNWFNDRVAGQQEYANLGLGYTF